MWGKMRRKKNVKLFFELIKNYFSILIVDTIRVFQVIYVYKRKIITNKKVGMNEMMEK